MSITPAAVPFDLRADPHEDLFDEVEVRESHRGPPHQGEQPLCELRCDALGPRFASGPGSRIGLDTGTLVIFDRRPEAAPSTERTAFEQVTTPPGRPVTVACRIP